MEDRRAHPPTYYVVDAFTNKAFQGNPAAVVILSKPGDGIMDDDMMQRIAMEIHLSETAFAWPNSDKTAYTIRYFTPTKEIELCGHATMATAKILFDSEDDLLDDSTTCIRFDTCFGESLYCTRSETGEISMRFPSDDDIVASSDDCGLTRAFAGNHTITGVYEGRFDIMVVMTSISDVQELQVDMNALEAATNARKKRGVIVTSVAEERNEVDFVSRFFAPGAGIPEDPVTGSAHCTLGPYWERVLKPNPGTRLVGRQIGPMRQGTVYVQCVDEKTVEISGNAVIVSKTTLYPSIFD